VRARRVAGVLTGGTDMNRGTLGAVLLGAALGAGVLGPAFAVEVGEPAPEFSMASTTGSDIALKDFRGKKWVLLEFYGADFSPACAANLSARKADFSRFEALGIQNLAASANLSFSQQTFAETLKLPFPLLSDFPARATMRSYGVLNEKTMLANRSFFLIDPQGVVRGKWMIENPVTTVVYSDGMLRDIRQIVGQQHVAGKR
jgi:peroxiredoxin